MSMMSVTSKGQAMMKSVRTLKGMMQAKKQKTTAASMATTWRRERITAVHSLTT